jgi:transposase-like protein
MDKLLLKEYYLLLAEKMVLSREEKEKMVLDLYYNRGYTYKQLTRELRMSPNQLREIIKRHEEKNDAIANKKKELSLSSQAYKLFYEGKNNVEVAIKLDLPQDPVTQFRLEYWRLQNQDKLETLHIVTKGKVSRLWKLYKELVINRGMSIEAVANIVDIDLNRLPDMEARLEETNKAVARKQVDFEYLEKRIRSLEEEEKRRRGIMITLPPSSYYYVENKENLAMNAFSYHPDPKPMPSSLPYWPSGNYDPWSEYRNKQKNSK